MCSVKQLRVGVWLDCDAFQSSLSRLVESWVAGSRLTVPLRSRLHHSLVWPELIRCYSGSTVTFSHIIPGQEQRKLSEDTCLLGNLLFFLLLSFLDTNQDEQAWPLGMTSLFLNPLIKCLHVWSPPAVGSAGDELMLCCWRDMRPLGETTCDS